MAGFDDPGVYFSDSFFSDDRSDGQQTRSGFQKKFKEFIKTFMDHQNCFCYRDQLKHHYNTKRYWLEVDLQDLASFDSQLATKLTNVPSDFLPLFEDAAKEAADELTQPRPIGEEKVQEIQIMLKSTTNPVQIRQLKSDHMAHLVKVPGIVINASAIRAKATHITIQCRNCKNFQSNIPIRPGLEGYVLPRKCSTEQTGQVKCSVDPYFIVPDKCKCVDFQTLKLQEAPDAVPNGELPRHLQLYCDRYLTEFVVPGNRVTVVGIYSIRKGVSNKSTRQTRDNKATVGIRKPYLRVVGIEIDSDGLGRSSLETLRPEEQEEMRQLAGRPDVYDIIAKSIAPSIYGGLDIKKALSCLLFGGSRKRLPDGLTRRGDINVLLLGDPGTAKSQLLKFVEKVSPIGVYTSGKGSSAAGLTASVLRDPSTRGFIVEGGAMVLADGGVVCIDEFDKMREDDRVAIHEAMEQQTISLAKAGITTTLNSRCSVLAAANSVFGRWDDIKGEANIDFMPTILSRFDMIFIIKDEHDFTKDTRLAKHVMKVHLNAVTEEETEGELSLSFLKKFIAFCKVQCGPRLSEAAADKLKNQYVMMRSEARQHEREISKKSSIPITVRQLEAIVRIAESLAKMSLAPFALESHIDEALRLFKVSTLDAAMSGSLSGAEGFTSAFDQEEVRKIERQLKTRFPIGSYVSEQRILQDFVKQNYSEKAIKTVLQTLIKRGELQHRFQRKVLLRIR
ncbi:PREDICTED: DNA replication licensing factor mcm5-A-like [Amphimedon queenslandica]|uniref:DNA replication licensing factor MCM5 n=1 Tax=Amphimedon queenslandica TaxID=400682 RepID=A0A1X7UJU1_AMPQE|nr:PREDICTED: DNA replication licensing factor mcm5-A-like [Amphimedon queenslandica]|eukprot:XP_003387600.1 PREDICTED: DNA replication licensing factor mcm5-A-like [Amphimedon queenslandica]